MLFGWSSLNLSNNFVFRFQLEEALNSAKEEYQDMFARIEFERAEYEQEIDSAQYEITTRDENIKVIYLYLFYLTSE